MKHYLKNLVILIMLLLKSLKPSQGQFGRDQFDQWTLPPALMNIAPGRYLTCPSELIQCQRITTYKRPICAISSDLKNVERKNFSTICDMRYTNCKLNKQYWNYLKDDDGKC